ncbi:MAG: P1 family peptidase, partial [Oscillospiraceae bacterium]
MQKRAEDFGIKIGSLKKGALNKITDVKGVTVGHCTVDNENNHTGVSVIIPQEKNMFTHKLPCAQFVINGYGKTAGLMQIEELGTLETPIAITNTLNVGLVQDALIQHMLDACEKDGVAVTSINPVVCECNDGRINNIAKRAVREAEVEKAFQNACMDFAEGAVGG